MNDCIFCKIIAGEVPCYKIYEDDYTLAFLDVAGDAFGHTLVVPKEHCENILDASDECISHVMSAVRKISTHFVDNCDITGVRVISNCKESAGQSVMHLHFHIYPMGQDVDCDLDKQRDMLRL